MGQHWHKVVVSWNHTMPAFFPLPSGGDEAVEDDRAGVQAAVATLGPEHRATLEITFSGNKPSLVAKAAAKILSAENDRLNEDHFVDSEDSCLVVAHPRVKDTGATMDFTVKSGLRFPEIAVKLFRSVLNVLGVEEKGKPYFLTDFRIHQEDFVKLEESWISRQTAIRISFRLPGVYII